MNIDRLCSFYKVFSDNTRLKILESLLISNKCVNDISNDINVDRSAVSHQLKKLRELNLVKSEKNGISVLYSIADDHIKIILEYGIEHINEEENQ